MNSNEFINARRTILPITELLKSGMKIQNKGKWLIAED
jgi:hypothetical protein